jgi:hypothetical protein
MNVYSTRLEVARMAHVESESVPRPPLKPRKGELTRLHILLSEEMVSAIDRLVAEMGPPTTRAEAIRVLLREGLKSRALLK